MNEGDLGIVISQPAALVGEHSVQDLARRSLRALGPEGRCEDRPGMFPIKCRDQVGQKASCSIRAKTGHQRPVLLDLHGPKQAILQARYVASLAIPERRYRMTWSLETIPQNRDRFESRSPRVNALTTICTRSTTTLKTDIQRRERG